MMKHYRRKTACSFNIEFGKLDEFAQRLWPWLHVPETSGMQLAATVADFVGQHVLPTMQGINTLETFFNFLVEDKAPWQWFATNRVIRVAQIVATALRLGVSEQAIRGALTPHEALIAADFRNLKLAPAICVDNFLQLVSDWVAQG
jgi:hypothetical protein